MTIRYLLDDSGGFTCGDTESGVTSYAYPSSVYADRAKAQPTVVAREMVEASARYGLPYEREYDARNWAKMGGRE